MNSELRKNLYRKFETKETEELLEIWKINNRVEWSDLTFDVIEEILKERDEELPSQNEPILEYGEEEDDGLEEWEAKLLDDENQPELYDTLEVLTLKDRIVTVVKAAVIIKVLLGIWSTQIFQEIVMFRSMPSMDNIDGLLLNFLIRFLVVGIDIALIYFPLKALTYILRILMEMEFNSRKAM